MFKLKKIFKFLFQNLFLIFSHLADAFNIKFYLHNMQNRENENLKRKLIQNSTQHLLQENLNSICLHFFTDQFPRRLQKIPDNYNGLKVIENDKLKSLLNRIVPWKKRQFSRSLIFNLILMIKIYGLQPVTSCFPIDLTPFNFEQTSIRNTSWNQGEGSLVKKRTYICLLLRPSLCM